AELAAPAGPDTADIAATEVAKVAATAATTLWLRRMCSLPGTRGGACSTVSSLLSHANQSALRQPGEPSSGRVDAAERKCCVRRLRPHRLAPLRKDNVLRAIRFSLSIHCV